MQQTRKYQIMALLLVFSLLTNTASVSAAKRKQAGQSTTSSISLNTSSSNLLLGDSMTLSVNGVTEEEVTYKSSDSTIVSTEPSEDGITCECTGESVGTATVTVKIKEKKLLIFSNTITTLTCKVTVTPKATSIKFARKSVRLAADTRKKLHWVLRPGITKEIPTFVSSDPEIASITPAGRVIARAKGTAVITASIGNGTTSTCKVIVTEKSESLMKASSKKNNK